MPEHHGWETIRPAGMIIHQLILHHLRNRDDSQFYVMQAKDAVGWIRKRGVTLGPQCRALDLGAGSGLFGAELTAAGCRVTFADEKNHLLKELQTQDFVEFQIGREPLANLGKFDLVIFSNVLEHINDPHTFIRETPHFLKPGGHLYLSWTNWLSPWGGHDFSPFHYLGPKMGPRLSEKFRRRRTIFTLGKDLFPTYIGETLRWIRSNPELRIAAKAPRYYPEFPWLVSLPLVREFLCWNTALLIQRSDPVSVVPRA